MGQSEMADIRAYRTDHAASGLGTRRHWKWVVDESIALEDAIVL